MAWVLSGKEAERLFGIKNKVESKYKNEKTIAFGKEFDSQLEAGRYSELLMMERAGEISDLKTQVPFVLVPEKREPDKVGPRGGIIKGKVIERGVIYRADFVYKDKNGTQVVEDTKGVKTKDYRLKRKLMLHVHGIKIKEVLC